MDLFHYLDVLIGYALAMIVLSTMIAAAASGWLGLIASRARSLENGLSAMLAAISGAPAAQSQALAQSILCDPILKPFGKLERWAAQLHLPGVERAIAWVRSFAAETVHREELALMILRMAGEGSEAAIRALGVPLSDTETAELQSLQTALAATGGSAAADQAARAALLAKLQELAPVKAARQMLADVEQTILAIEVDQPSLPSQVWQTKALQKHAPQLAARLFARFDNLMDRVEDNASFSAKLAAAGLSALFLIFYPVDSMAMLTRLSANTDTLSLVVAEAVKVKQGNLGTQLQEAETKLLAAGLFGDFGKQSITDPSINLAGVFATWVMVSLGAPFWLNILDKLLGLRSIVQTKANEQRAWRQKEQQPAPAAKASSAVAGGQR
jgi:hypothetical protein